MVIVMWMFMGLVITLYDHLLLTSQYAAGIADKYSLGASAIRNVGAGLIGGLLGGSFMIFFVNVRFRDKPYGYTILSVCLSFALIVAFVTVVMAAILVPIETGRPLAHPSSRAAVIRFVTDTGPLKAGLVWLFIVGVTQLFMQVSQKFGRGIFWSLMLGRYHTPREASRTFMFLDLNDSTTIAERLGDKDYHLFIKEFFSDITDPILRQNGSVYQYVGDAVVIVWDLENEAAHTRAVQCFFDIQEAIAAKATAYRARFGVVPSFKAAIHGGKIVAGEIGIIKRDITFSGDVLNTTSRIQQKCKELGAQLIVSGPVAARMKADSFKMRPLGMMPLRGKEKQLELVAVEAA